MLSDKEKTTQEKINEIIALIMIMEFLELFYKALNEARKGEKINVLE